MNLRAVHALTALLFLLVSASCAKSTNLPPLEFDSTPVISKNDRFALILDPYVSLRDAPGESGITISHARRGDVHDVLGVRILSSPGGKPVQWLELDEGWITASSVSLFSNKRKALRVSETLGD